MEGPEGVTEVQGRVIIPPMPASKQTHYETLGVLGENFFNGPGRTFDAATVSPEQFRSVGAPRGIWDGLKYDFDKPVRK